MHGEAIENEIILKEDECCIVFDFGCYFPYSNPEILTFDFSLGELKFDDYKKNHRYPNHFYQTISKKNGRKVSKLGYPYVMKLNEQVDGLLCVKVGIKDRYLNLIFPLHTEMTKEKPICGLSLHYNFDEHGFYFASYERCDDCGWYQHAWTNNPELLAKYGERTTLITPCPGQDNDSHMLIYQETICPMPSTISGLMI